MFEFGFSEDEWHQGGAGCHRTDVALESFEKGFAILLAIFSWEIVESHLIANEFAFGTQS